MTRITKSLLATLGLALLGTLAAGCRGSAESTAEPDPTQLTVIGSPEMNSGGNAAVVRVYQLAGDANFQRSTIEAFWRNDEEALGQELLAVKQEFVVYPNERTSFTLDLLKETKFVGVAADLRAPDRNEWRVLYPALDLHGKAVTVTVQNDRLVVGTD